MIGLLSPPAVIRLLARESTPVRLASAVGHRFERTSRVTCCNARAVNRATEICGLFFNARASASFRDRAIRFVGLAWEGDDSWPIGDVLSMVMLVAACGIGADGKPGFCMLNDACAQLQRERSGTDKRSK